jgi:hypothetical protein
MEPDRIESEAPYQAQALAVDVSRGWRKPGEHLDVVVSVTAQVQWLAVQQPEERVNNLFRASLWHALRLARRHGGEEPDVRIDLPYSNFAYSQTGTPWPINQAVYVDYMLYDLRGYHAISTEELKAQFRNNQEHDGHVSGYANWLVYTPGMLYAVAQNYLLSRDRDSFERLLPESIKAMDWCLDQIRNASRREGPARGLVNGPLNDGTGEGIWAFNQAYMFAGLDLFGRALHQHGHPRASEAREAARTLREAIARGFAVGSLRSPLVQLRDGTWMPYVPAEALTPHRLLEQWYPTDVDTGAVHLLRLKALPVRGVRADSLLNDHEDNLFYKGWGMANEPVYNQQATAYLLRDEPEAAIRAFYSYIASAFSHSVLEPVEHRWSHGQYFGPPSTDGAWFELYRNMLVHERDDDALLLAQAIPRAWLQDGKKIELRRVPTYYGQLSTTIESRARSGEISADVRMPDAGRPRTLLVRFRHPDRKAIRSVSVNGRAWQDFDALSEWVRLPDPRESRYVSGAGRFLRVVRAAVQARRFEDEDFDVGDFHVVAGMSSAMTYSVAPCRTTAPKCRAMTTPARCARTSIGSDE